MPDLLIEVSFPAGREKVYVVVLVVTWRVDGVGVVMVGAAVGDADVDVVDECVGAGKGVGPAS